ncbi:MAG: flagellar export protein FliJ [Clostridia bacterium]|nr:flagellar export protein FliJ [Clostridia bacterium]
MKKFRFSLDLVLSYKQQILDVLMGEHAEILARLHAQEDLIEALRRQYHDYNADYRERSAWGLPITEAMIAEANLRALEREIDNQLKRLDEIRAEEEQKREEVIEGKKDTSALEKLKEKKWKEHQKAEQKSEEAFIEEFVTTARLSAGQ